MTAPVPPVEMLDALTQCAYRLGRAFAAEAERSHGKAMLAAYERFNRCFFSVRMGIALKLRLGRAEPVRLKSESEREPTEREPSDHHTAAEPRERERDRETERASMPLLLNALETVAAYAASLPGPAPAALITLRELLATFSSAPAPALAPALAPITAPPRPSGDLRTRLAATSASILTIPPPPRHATGPPRR